jgi:glycosyltransferase involved in cell wall biosynthesis
MYNSPEEQAMINAVSGNHDVPSVVVGVGSEVPADPQPERFRQKYGIDGRFAIYVGRIDENKGCKELFEFFEGYVRDVRGALSLLLVGQSILPIPEQPRIAHLGFLSDQDKFDAMAAADLLIVPSPFESLSMVTLEAWALGRPVIVNGKCDVLKGQCIRSGAGLFYESYPEFLETLGSLERSRRFRAALGQNGRRYFRQHYTWPVIEQKYLSMLERLQRDPSKRPMPPLPSWLRRRRRNLPPGREVVESLPRGHAATRMEESAA